MQSLISWLATGGIIWLCTHTMTLLFPLPGPWLPIRVAVPTGLLMGLGGYFLTSPSRGVRPSRTNTALFCVAGLWAGAYLGWTSARGELADQGTFLEATIGQQLFSALVCGMLGLVANRVMIWLVGRTDGKPLRLALFLLGLLSTFLLGVLLVILVGGR